MGMVDISGVKTPESNLDRCNKDFNNDSAVFRAFKEFLAKRNLVRKSAPTQGVSGGKKTGVFLFHPLIFWLSPKQ